MSLFDALYAFFQEHRRCGELDGGVEGDRVWMTCTCGAPSTGTLTATEPTSRRLVRGTVLVCVVSVLLGSQR